MTLHPLPSHLPPGRPAPLLSPLRIGDADRQHACTLLSDHYAAGRLDFAEFAARQEAALAATTGLELGALLRDLPMPPAAPGRPPAPRSPEPPAWLTALRVLTTAGVTMTMMMMFWLVLGRAPEYADLFGMLLTGLAGTWLATAVLTRWRGAGPGRPDPGA